MPRTRVLIVAPQPLYRRGMRLALEGDPTLEVIGEQADGPAALAACELALPDVMVCDLAAPGRAGVELTRRVRQRWPRCAVVLLGPAHSDETVFEAIRAGAAALLPREADELVLAAAVRRAAGGEYPINEAALVQPLVAGRVLDAFRALAQVGDAHALDQLFSPLTPRELEILEAVARGLSNKEIGRSLAIADQTVKNHLTSILRKLAVNDRTQAVIYALRRGWITIPDERHDAAG